MRHPANAGLDGPLLVISGPGSGKTYSIVLRALNLLLLGRAQPNEIVLTTFTQKAAFEMRDRLAAAARKVGYVGDLSELTISTIHSLCDRILTQHRHRTLVPRALTPSERATLANDRVHRYPGS
jgi:DNA helicase-2/ATP-dependent DNA helicase PcrA